MTTTRPPFRLTAEQYDRLIMALDASRVGKNPKGFSHMEAWDIRRWLIRVFGFGSFDIETVQLDLVKEIESPPGSIKHGNGGTNNKTVWTTVYRAQVRLTIWDQHGGYVVLEDGACGDSTNQPSLGDCHDNAAKTALSQALKRCAVNLGDCFGLSLYNGGGTQAVVNRSLIAPEMPSAGAPAAKLPADAPVMPEPGIDPAVEDSAHAEATVQPTAEPAAEPAAEPKAPSAAGIRDWALKPGRTADEIRTALARLQAEHPAVAERSLQNEHGDQETLAAMLTRLTGDTPAAPAPIEPEPAPDAPPMVTQEQHARMHVLWGKLGFVGDVNRDNRLVITGKIVGRTLASSKELTAAEASKVINALQDRLSQRQRQAAA